MKWYFGILIGDYPLLKGIPGIVVFANEKELADFLKKHKQVRIISKGGTASG